MTGIDMYSYGKAGIGMASDIYGAWQTGERYEAESEAYRRDKANETQRNKVSFMYQEHAKDRAEFGAGVFTEEYLHAGQKKLESIEGNLADINTQTLLQTSIAYEQSAAVDETVGNMMSRNAVDAMKAEARLVAASAGTGTSGGSTEVATTQARSVEMFDNSILIGRAAGQKLNINRRLQMERISARNKKKYIASEVGQVMGAQGAGAAHSKGFAQSYAGLSRSVKEGYLALEKVQVRDTSTWADAFFDGFDTFVQGGGDDALTRYLGEGVKPSDRDGGALELEKQFEANKKNVMLVPDNAKVASIY